MNDFMNPAALRDRLQEWLDQRIEIVLAQLLRAGVLASALVVIVGAVLYLGNNPRARVDYHTFRAQPEQLRSVHGVFDAALQGQTAAILQLGLLLLVATPIARVLFSVFAFALEGDRMYVAFTLTVLAVLLYSLFGSFLIA
ncbi:MAG TPA: DUF1634 domain-containing protein [Terriglobales bacterium]|jgi:uncharacterized membrane protein|nr:DUF1634 domain-containing protein [Terriglobales bacterium]